MEGVPEFTEFKKVQREEDGATLPPKKIIGAASNSLVFLVLVRRVTLDGQ